MKHQESSAENALPQNPRFDGSWQQLLASGRKLLALTEANHWPQARRLRSERLELSRKHFARFPVGPEYRVLYRDRLQTLFEMELNIDNAFAAQNRAGRQHRHLSLVR